MNQDVLTYCQICLLLSKGHSCYRPRTGERHGKSVQCYFVDANQSVLNSVNVKKKKKGKQKNGRGEKDLFLDSLILLCYVTWDPKDLAESTNFLVSLKKSCPLVCCEKAPKQGR